MATREKPVFFAFYPDDFRGGTDHMTNDEVGCYIRLLMYQFDNGAIPKTTLQRMNLCRITDVGQWNRIWDSIGEKFECIDEQGSLANPRMEGERQDAIKRAGYIEKRRADGKRGAQKRWKKQGSDRDPNGDPIGTPNNKPDPEPEPDTPNTALNTASNTQGALDAKASGAECAGVLDLYDQFLTAWNFEFQRSGNRAHRRTKKGQRSFPARWKEPYFREHYVEAMRKAADLLRGVGWANPDWFLRPDTVSHIMTGRYDFKRGTGTTSKDELRRRAQELTERGFRNLKEKS